MSRPTLRTNLLSLLALLGVSVVLVIGATVGVIALTDPEEKVENLLESTGGIDVLRAIERDRGFRIVYPGADLLGSSRQRCTYLDLPETWRQFRAEATPESAHQFYAARLSDFGWTSTSAVRFDPARAESEQVFTKRIAGADVYLTVTTSPQHSGITIELSATVDCDTGYGLD